MSAGLRHNGCDTLMLGFDYELRRRGFAGNSCQIILELSDAIDPMRLERRLAELFRLHPILGARPPRAFLPRWRPTGAAPRVRVHRRAGGVLPRLFNEPLDIQRGELIRFDLVDSTLVFTWSHALMDAKSAEYFLAVVGGETLTCPEGNDDWYAQRARRAGGLRARGRQAWRELERIEGFKKALPVSPATRRPPRSGTMNYHLVALSREETAQVRAHAARFCGLLGDTNYHLAVTLMALHRLHQRAGCASASYVVPVPVGLRPKGTRAPVFSNQLTIILQQFFPEQLASLGQAITAVKAGHVDCLRGDYVNASVALAQLFRRMPLRLYMWMVKRELRGEICSLFFGDAGVVDPALERFLDATIREMAHVPAVTVPPGVGVVLYRFGHQLRFTVVHAEGTLSDGEASEFAADLRTSLLNP